MTFNPDESQLNALKTWYSIDNPLHFGPRHAVIKLAGEAGEILDLYGKHEYKPNFSWWNCKHCGYGDASHSSKDKYCPDWKEWEKTYTPLILDELGDYSYYLRILAYQKGISFEATCRDFEPHYRNNNSIDKVLASLNRDSADLLVHYLIIGNLHHTEELLRDMIYDFLAILSKLDTTLQQVLDLNYKKLNSEPTNHGWKNATMKTIDDCPRMSEFY